MAALDAIRLWAQFEPRACKPVGGSGSAPVASWLTGERGPVPKLVWRVKLVAELEPGVTTETEVARIERDEEASLVGLGLKFDEAKRLTATLQAEIVTAQAHLGVRHPIHTRSGAGLARSDQISSTAPIDPAIILGPAGNHGIQRVRT